MRALKEGGLESIVREGKGECDHNILMQACMEVSKINQFLKRENEK